MIASLPRRAHLGGFVLVVVLLGAAVTVVDMDGSTGAPGVYQVDAEDDDDLRGLYRQLLQTKNADQLFDKQISGTDGSAEEMEAARGGNSGVGSEQTLEDLEAALEKLERSRPEENDVVDGGIEEAANTLPDGTKTPTDDTDDEEPQAPFPAGGRQEEGMDGAGMPTVEMEEAEDRVWQGPPAEAGATVHEGWSRDDDAGEEVYADGTRYPPRDIDAQANASNAEFQGDS